MILEDTVGSIADIDLVLTWLDDSDPAWQVAYHQAYSSLPASPYLAHLATGASAFRDFGLLKYLLRGVDAFLPWIRKVHLVTNTRTPQWLRTDSQRLQLVSHEDIFPDASVLPTFNGAAIESCLGYIPDLAERFIYCNDDVLFLSPVPQERYFVGGKAVECWNLDYVCYPDLDFTLICHFTHAVIAGEYQRRRNALLMQRWKEIFHWRNGLRANVRNALHLCSGSFPFTFRHGPAPMLRSMYELAEDRFTEVLEQTRRSPFRHQRNVFQYFFRALALLEGKTYPRRYEDFLYVPLTSAAETSKRLALVRSRAPRSVCFNDTKLLQDQEVGETRALLHAFLKELLPQPSQFER